MAEYFKLRTKIFLETDHETYLIEKKSEIIIVMKKQQFCY